MRPDTGIIIAVLFSVLIAGSAFRWIRKGERAAVFRLGRFLRVDGPGTIMVIPVIDRVRKVKLDDVLPSWRGMSPAEVEEVVRRDILKV